MDPKVIYYVYVNYIRGILLKAVKSTDSSFDDVIFNFVDKFFKSLGR